MASTTQSTHIRVLSASTGFCYNITLHPSELNVANIRRHLAAAVPQSDQILLLGPPYKVPKDATLQSEEVLNSLRLGDVEDDPSQKRTILSSTEQTGARRLFLFSKRALSENAPDPSPCQLEPMNLTLPTEPGPSPLPPSQSPLHQALEVYERQFMLHLVQGRVLADGADMRLSSCKTCVLEQAVMARALRAAVSNLSVHLNGTLRTRSDLSTAFQTKTSRHAVLLQRFESLLTSLDSIPLDPALVSVARAQGRVMETLLDTVPVERERAWANQCQTSHQRLMTLFGELNTAFGQLGTTASREEESKLDLQAEEEIKELWNTVQGRMLELRNLQAKRLGNLTTNHGEVVKIIMNAINSGGGQAAFPKLEEMSTASAEILPAMQADDQIMLQLMKKFASSKTRAMKRMKIRLREVSVAQSGIQRVNSSVVVLRDALAQQCENMVHLEHVAELPNSYRDFLSEIRRRRAYGGAVASTSAAMMERLASMRDDEVKAREKFLRGSGRHLMPTFFEIFAPTLATPPPLFTPQLPSMNELESLPNVATGGSSSSDAQMQGNASADVPTSGVSSASSLTAASQPPTQEAEPMMATGTIPEEGEPQGDQLIVSADEHSGQDLIVEPSGGSAADAERKTLAYENAVLRQALERLGGKSPRTYVEESRAAEQQENVAAEKTSVANEDEVAALRKELQDAKEQVRKANEALVEAKKQHPKESDKISHSSFEVGDIGLFMLTGRGPAGKRTYLAFHTNCPHRYLSTDCIKGTPDCVLGRIVYQEELVAGEKGTDANPYGLRVGTPFFVLTVEVISTL